MIQIILQVLAVIGIILLCLLGLVLIVTSVIMFVPVRYQFSGRMEENLECRAKATWLAHLLSISYVYPEPGQIIIKFLGIKVRRISFGNEEPKEQAETKPQSVSKDPKPCMESKPDVKTKEKTKRKTDSLSKIEKKCTISNVCDKIKYYWEVLRDQDNRRLFIRCRKRIVKVLRHVFPRTLHGELLIGTGQPDTTGYVLAVYGMLFPILGNHINITPDFENKVFQGNWSVKGRIRAVVFFKNVLGVVFDRQLRAFIRQLKKEGK
ncbi:MAG: DUF2953 domain-containing protein [Lachnospiraceae bacterium]|nr:DUF2953 domain-containing protein [Lachnospiraceae bacterium]